MQMAIKRGTRQLTVAQARQGLAAVLHDVERGETVSVTRRGRPVAVLVSAARFERLQAGRADFWARVEQFRRRVGKDSLLADELLEGLRDRAPGRPDRS